MALLTAYANATQYVARSQGKGNTSDTTLSSDLLAASRWVDDALGLSAGAFNNVSNTTLTFDAHGGSVLWLRDRGGKAYFLQDVNADGIGIDTEYDGTFDGYQLDFVDEWIRGLPENAVDQGKAYTSLELLLHLPTVKPSSGWPTGPYAVRIQGDWGFASMPDEVVALTIARCHDMRSGQLVGAVNMPGIDGGIPLSDQTWRAWRALEHIHSRWVPAL